MAMTSRARTIWLGDNLESLTQVEAGSVMLAYCDPPFNSGRSFEAVLGLERETANAFADAWLWTTETTAALANLEDFVPKQAAAFIRSLVETLGKNELAAYLVMMSARLGAIYRVLHQCGSLYLHCDPAASHYLKVVLDHIFGPENFRNEVIWRRTHAHSGSRRFGPVHDTILFYSKSKNYIWNQIYAPYSKDYIDNYFTKEDEHGRYQLITCTGPGDRTGTRAHYRWRGKLPPSGRHWAWTSEKMEELDAAGLLVHSSNGIPRLKRYVDDGPGVRVQDVWNDIGPLSAHSLERTGFETQKPLGLLWRIIEASTNPGDRVLDAFGGSGTTAVAAESMGRSWTTMDTSLLACSLTLARVRQQNATGHITLANFPTNMSDMIRLRKQHPITFAVWGTGILGTLLDKKRMSETIAGGVGSLGGNGQARVLSSWVPLQNRMALRDVPIDTSEGHVFMLNTGGDIPQLARRVGNRQGVEVVSVPMEECLDAEALSLGMAPSVAEIALS